VLSLISACIAPIALSCAPSTAAVTAVRVSRPPGLDALADADMWRSVAPTSDFRQWSPNEDGTPSLRTEFRVAYDARNLYVLVRAFDPRPDSIVRTVTRRDGTSASDEIGIYLDTDGQRRNGYEFYVNAAGVRRDVALSSDAREDVTWDAVWDAVVRVDSLGWTAAFQIPFSQLRFPPAAHHRFGFLVNRVIQRRAERVSWPAYHPSQPGIVSQFGVLDGLDGIDQSWTAELSPFTRVQSRGAHATSAGGDAHVNLSSSATIDATARPDFGQVEADPSVVNLTSVETFYPERRPFFLDGSGTYRVGFNCTSFLCANEELFYSRRIGRAPQLSSLNGGGSNDPAPILAAAKLGGQMTGRLTVGALAATTGCVSPADDHTLEPATRYGVARVVGSSSDGRSGASLVMTAVDRSLDSWSRPYLARSAMVAGGTFRHRFGQGQYEVWGSTSASRLAGSAASIAAIQKNGVHDLQRPGFAVPFDSSRTSLAGDQEEIAIGKYGGRIMFEGAYERQSAGFDPNDLGYLQRADEQAESVWLGYTTLHPHAFYNRVWWNLNQWNRWNAAGLRLETSVNANAHVLLVNNAQLNAGATLSQIGSGICDHCARGGPAMRSDAQLTPFIDLVADTRTRVVPELYVPARFADGGRSRSVTLNPTVNLRLSSRVQSSVGVSIATNHDNTQWVGQFSDSGQARYAFARIDQRTRSVTLRASYAATTNLTLETYAAPFVSDGVYSTFRALSGAPLARRYDDRFVAFDPPPATQREFGVRQVRATTVLRWEYAPGSTLFLVWSNESNATRSQAASGWSAARDVFAVRPVNTLTAKVSYRIAP
jgi:hypothetical protein